jgi:hypothetical protein
MNIRSEGLAIRTKKEFLREWMRSDERNNNKSWTGDVAGKEFSGSPTFYAFVDMDYFGLLSELSWTRSPPSDAPLKVPRGFVTDFASVPRLFWSFFPPIGRYGYAALFHDYVYWLQEISRAEADAVFRDTMKELGVPPWKYGIL